MTNHLLDLQPACAVPCFVEESLSIDKLSLMKCLTFQVFIHAHDTGIPVVVISDKPSIFEPYIFFLPVGCGSAGGGPYTACILHMWTYSSLVCSISCFFLGYSNKHVQDLQGTRADLVYVCSPCQVTCQIFSQVCVLSDFHQRCALNGIRGLCDVPFPCDLKQ